MNQIALFTREEFESFIKRMRDEVSHSKATPNQRMKMMNELTEFNKIASIHDNEELHTALKNRVDEYRRMK